MARYLPLPWRFLDDATVASLLNGGKIYIYEPGTTTDKTAYRDAAESAQHTQPIVLDQYGQPPDGIFVDGLCKVVVKDSSDVQVYPTFDAIGPDIPAVISEDNLSFEVDTDSNGVPDNWSASGSEASFVTQVTTEVVHGAKAVEFAGVSSSNARLDYTPIPVSALVKYRMAFSVKVSNALCTPAVKLRWLDKAQAFISEATIWTPPASGAPTSWTRLLFFIDSVPANATFVQIRIDGNSAGTAYTAYFDNFVFAELDDTLLNAVHQPVGLNYSVNATDTANDIDISPGSVLADDGSYVLVLTEAITKQSDVSFAEGTDQGGRSSTMSKPVDGIYWIFLIGDSDTGRVDVLFDTNLSPTMPTGYDKKRRIGAVTTDSAQDNENFVFFHDTHVILADVAPEFQDTTLTSGALETKTIQAPPGAIIDFAARVEIVADSATEIIGLVRPADAVLTTPKFGTGMETFSDTLDELWWHGHDRVDDNQQIQHGVIYVGHSGGVENDFYVKGWRDLGRMAL